MSTKFDLSWLVEAAGTDKRKMVQLAVLIASAIITEAVMENDGCVERILHYREIVRELNRKIK